MQGANLTNSNSKKGKGQVTPNPRPDHIQSIFDDFHSWLRRIEYSRPRNVEDIIPQFFADKIMKNIRLAAIFSIGLVEFQDSSYEKRLDAWADNLVHCFGKAVSPEHYTAWKDSVSVSSFTDPDVEKTDIIRARIFLADVHDMANRWGDIGKAFLNDLFFWVWHKLETKSETIWTQKEETANSAPFESAYSHETNTALKPEHLRKEETYTYRPSDKVLNRLSSNFSISLASKSKRNALAREFVCYGRNFTLYTVSPGANTLSAEEWRPWKLEDEAKPKSNGLKDPSPGAQPKGTPSSNRIRKKKSDDDDVEEPEEERAQTKRQREGTPINNGATPFVRNPPTTDHGGTMGTEELGEGDGETESVDPIPFPNLEIATDRDVQRLLDNESFRAQFFRLAEESGHMKARREREDGEESEGDVPTKQSPSKPRTKFSSSSSSSSSEESGGKELKELTSNLIAKSKTDIRFKELSPREISAWGDAVESFEAKYGPWDRNQIDRTLRRRINSRWTLDVYMSLLPASLQDNPEGIVADSWLDPKIISTVDLARFLKKTCSVGEGTKNLNAGYDEMLDLVKNYSLPMRKGTIARGLEDFSYE